MFTLNNRGLVYVGCGFLFVGFLVSWLVLVGWFFFTFFFSPKRVSENTSFHIRNHILSFSHTLIDANSLKTVIQRSRQARKLKRVFSRNVDTFLNFQKLCCILLHDLCSSSVLWQNFHSVSFSHLSSTSFAAFF